MRLKSDIFLEDEVATNDSLGYQPYVNAISSAILNDEVKTPFVIGIYGKWGSGKSSLMNLVRGKVDKKGKNIVTVFFTPWQYQKQDNVLIPLFLTLKETIEKSPTFTSRMKDVTTKIKKVASITSETVLYSLLNQIIGSNELKNIAKSYEERTDITASLEFGRTLYFRKLKSDFQNLVSYLVSDTGKLIIFIDDLDRCPPEQIIEMLESIKLFIGVKNCIFIIGMNYDIIASCIKYKYRDYHLKGEDVEEYLEKIVQLPFRIPALHPKAIEKFIDKIETDEDICKLKSFFSEFLPKNPRKIKKVLNVFRLTIKLAKLSGLIIKTGKSKIDVELLAKIIVIRERWLNLYIAMEKKPQILGEIETDPRKFTAPVVVKDGQELMEMLKYGTKRFKKQTNLNEYFSLTETTSFDDFKEKDSVVSEGELTKANDQSSGNVDGIRDGQPSRKLKPIVGEGATPKK